MIKKVISVFCAVIVVFCGMLFSGCGNKKETENGLTFISISDYQEKYGKTATDKWETDKTNGYVCRITADAPTDVVIPDEYKEKPVIAAEMDDDKTTRKVESITFGKNIKVVQNVVTKNTACPGLKSITFPDALTTILDSFNGIKDMELTIPASVKRVSYSFEDTENVTVTFEKESSIDLMTGCFTDSKNLKVIVQDENRAKEILNQSIPIAKTAKPGAAAMQKIDIGTEKIIAYSDKVDARKICDQAEDYFGAALDESKKIQSDEAGKFADLFDGPIFVTKVSAEKQNNEAYLPSQYISVADMSTVYPNRYRVIMKDRNEPKVYCIAERIKGKSVDYQSGNAYDAKKTIYHMEYRISLRNLEDGELLCWFEMETGYEPEGGVYTYRQGEDLRRRLGFQDGEDYYFYEKEDDKLVERTPYEWVYHCFFDNIQQ